MRINHRVTNSCHVPSARLLTCSSNPSRWRSYRRTMTQREVTYRCEWCSQERTEFALSWATPEVLLPRL